MTRRHLSTAILILGLAGLAVAAFALRRDVDSAAAAEPRVAIPTVLLAMTSVVAAAHSWSALAGTDGASRGRRRAEFYRAQLAKYLPAGALLTAAGQTALASTEAGRTRSLGSFAINAIGVVCAGLVFGPLVAIGLDRHVALRALLWCAPLALVFLNRRAAVAVLGKFAKNAELLPDQRAIVRSFGFSILNMASTSVAFVWLLSQIDDIELGLTAVGAFAIAWVIGFLIIPLPSGVGARELVLLALIPGISTAGLVTASVLHRLGTLGAEVAMAAVTTRRLGEAIDTLE